MIPAYNKIYLSEAQRKLAKMLDVLVNTLNYPLNHAWRIFLQSRLSHRFETGDCSIIAGRSGTEMVIDILKEKGIVVKNISQTISTKRSEEYWTGWALAYYQWKSGLTFNKIEEKISIEKIRNMYIPYHEMDIEHFCNKMDQYCKNTQSVI